MKTKLILALDLDSLKKAKNFLNRIKGLVEWVKVGSQLFVSEGPAVINELKRDGYKIFLDLKLHDIPNTVAGTVAKIRNFGVDMLTVHISGGKEMLISARKEAGENTKVVGVTVLTSLAEQDLKQLGIERNIETQVLALAQLAKESGIDGIVCSPMEAAAVRRKVGNNFIIITPGIRFDTQSKDDQKRALSPEEIRSAGVNFIVVGRPILSAEDPSEVIRKILKSL